MLTIAHDSFTRGIKEVGIGENEKKGSGSLFGEARNTNKILRKRKSITLTKRDRLDLT